MKRVLELLVLATVLAVCSANCKAGLDGHPDWYQCVNLTNLEIPLGVSVIQIVNSSIDTIPTAVFSKYGETLQQLNISYSGVKHIESDAFSGLGKLYHLSLDNNDISILDAKWLKDLGNLRRLVVWGNHISQIIDLSKLVPNLECLDIAYNDMFACLEPEMLQKLTFLNTIYISDNPWSYRCYPSMVQYLKKHHIHYIDDWNNIDVLIQDCIAHDPYSLIDDGALHKCVKHKSYPFRANALADVNEQIRELTKKITDLQADVATLKKHIRL